ncbi:hypothetical protein B5X24_HaOG212819 [Helicoverpa armigera]|nr:hypothetical protein B5X24_HaOG212819 [Helicoverpa armigera]
MCQSAYPCLFADLKTNIVTARPTSVIDYTDLVDAGSSLEYLAQKTAPPSRSLKLVEREEVLFIENVWEAYPSRRPPSPGRHPPRCRRRAHLQTVLKTVHRHNEMDVLRRHPAEFFSSIYCQSLVTDTGAGAVIRTGGVAAQLGCSGNAHPGATQGSM